MSKWKRLAMATISTSILLTQGGPLPYLASASVLANQAQINGDVKFSWTTPDQVMIGTSFNPYEGLQAIDADGDNVAVLVQVAGEVDTSRVGTYSIIYSIKNVNDETFTMTRQVEVVASNSKTDAVTDESSVSNEQETKEPDSQEEVIKGSPLQKEPVEDEASHDEITPSLLSEVAWTVYNRMNQQEWLKFNVNVETGCYEGQISPSLKEHLVNGDEDTLNQEVLQLRIWSGTQDEKLSTTLTVRDLLAETDSLKLLKELPYEIGDQINLIPVLNETLTLSVNGVIGGDISNEQANYENGIQNEDYLHNVRFQLTEEGLKTIYNEAPRIEGVQDLDVSDFESFDPMSGVSVKDDHDDNLLPHLKSTVEQLDETHYQVTYQVTDSWGRTTKRVRRITEKQDNEQLMRPLINEDRSNSTLANNTITVRGIEYPNTTSGDKRFDITFNTSSKRIYITHADGRSMNSRVEGDYFKLVLYNSKGAIKNELTLKGRDRAAASASAEMNALINTGWRYSIGDFVQIWHYEPNGKISIAGKIINSDDESFDSNVSEEMLRLNRFELTNNGLKKISNQAPKIALVEEKEADITVARGDSVDILKDLTITDDHDNSHALEYSITNFNTLTTGTYPVTIKVTDSWGESSTFTRNIIVKDKNELDAIRVNFLSESGDPVFDLQFDEVAKQIKLSNQTATVFKSDDTSDVIIISIYNKNGKIRRTVRIKGTDHGNSASIRALQNFKYNEGDYVNITPVEPKFVKITGTVADNPEGIDYTQTLSDLDKYKNVRFQLTEGNFKYIYNAAPVINNIEPKSIVRGTTFDPLEGVSVTDDKDGSIPKEQVKVSYDHASLSRIGTTIVRYTVSDSWGRTTTSERTITVIAPHRIEENKIVIKQDEEEFLSIGFDSLTKKLQVLDLLPDAVLNGTDHQEAFRLTLYGSDKIEKGSVTLNYHTEVSDAFIKQVEAMTYEEGDYIRITSPIYNSIEVIGKDNQINNFEDEEKLLHTRVELQNEGIKVIYNKAPKFKGVENVRVVYGNTFDPMGGVTVEDEDTDLTVKVSGNEVNNQREFTATKIGTYQLTYSVTDSYGRTTTATRMVEIVPVYTTNEVQYYNSSSELLFAIGINESATGFTYRLPKSDIDQSTDSSQSPSTISANQEESSDSAQPDQEEPTTPDSNPETLFKFTVYDDGGVSVLELKVTDENEINEELFSNLSSLTVRPGYRFSVEAKDLTKLKVTGQLNKKEQSELTSVDYNNLTANNSDVVENVRFELTTNIVEVIYNKAPVITIEPTGSDSTDSESNSATLNVDQSVEDATNASTKIIRNKALSVEEYNLLEGVTVKDDKDNLTITVNDVQVATEMLVDELTASVATIGQTYTVTYQITDSWGRQSAPVERQVQIKSAMDDVNIIFLHAGSGLQPSMTNKAATLSFNMDKERITVTQQNPNFKYTSKYQYGAFSITKPTDDLNSPTFKYILGGTNTYDQDTEFVGASLGNPVNLFKTALEAGRYQYGDKIKIKIAQSPFVYIEGTVINAQEDYINGAKLGSVLENSYFEITPEGLKQEYTPPATINPTFSEMTWYSGVAGNKSFSIALNTDNPNQLKLISKAYETEPIDTLEYNQILQIHLYGLNGQKRLETNSTGRRTPSEVAGAWNEKTVSVGEYFKINILKNTRLANLKLFNLPSQMFFPTNIDYTDIIKDSTYFNDVRFYVGSQGLVPVYNKGPVFNGAEDTDVIVGTDFNVRAGVTVSDEIDGIIPTYTVSHETIDTDTVGTHTITYRATDSWGRETTHTRTINVRPKLFSNKVQVYATNTLDSPAFEIIFDNQKQTQGTDVPTKSTTNSQPLGGFTINRYSKELLDKNQPTQDVFKLWVLNANGTEKAKVILQGRDTADSDKLNVLDTIDYRDGDIIKVWRRPNSSQTADSIETLKITGNVLDKNNNSVDFSDGLSTVEKMNNTIFKVSNNGLQSFYNEAPQFEGLQDKVLYYGESFNKLDGISVTDDYQNLTLSEGNVTTNFVQDTVGNYTATYTITDAFGRTTSQTVNIKVKSNLEKNKIKIHGSTTIGDELKFSIGFNDLGNKFVLEGTDSAIEKLPFSGTFQLTVYSRNGNIKHQMTINEDDTEEMVRQKLNELKDLTLTTGDSIALNHSDSGYVKIEGTIQGTSPDYSNGFTENTMSTVRFQLTPDGLKEIKATDFTITVDGSLTIKRGEEYNLLEGLSVQHPTETISITNTSVTIAGFDISQIGEQTVTYTVTDSWGKSASVTRQVTVEALNAVDTNKIHVKSEVLNSKRLTIGFDALEMKLTAKPQDNIISKIFKDLPKDSVVFSLSIYDNNQELQSTYTFNANDVNSYSQVMKQINNQTFNYGDYIALTAYNYDKLDFDGTVTLDERNQQNTSRLSDSATTVDKSAFIMNARFQITEDGLVALYNEAPTLTKKDSSTDIELSIGEEDKILDFIAVTDDLDELTTSDVEIKTEADFYHPGQYEVTYTVTDTWGRTASLTATLYVLSELQKNEIIVKSADNQEKLFTVGFNSKTEQLTWTFNEQNSEPLDASKGNQEVMSLTIYNEKGEKLQRLSLNGNDTKDTIKQNLSSFIDNYKYHYGYYINIDIADERTQNITITNVEIQSEQIPEDSYQEGVVTNKDYFENVRFELEAQLGLVAIYNEAPILTLEDEHKEFIKSLDINDYDLLSGISLSDDQDVLDVEQHVKIYCNPEENDSTITLDDANNENNIYYADRLHLGDNQIYYVVTDSWGRESEPKSRTLTLTHAMKNTSIVFDRVVLKQNVDSSSDIPALTINYDPDTNRLYATKGTAPQFKDRFHAYTIDVYDKNDNRVYGAIYGLHDNEISFFKE